jgi:preprotein translocase subunit SecA
LKISFQPWKLLRRAVVERIGAARDGLLKKSDAELRTFKPDTREDAFALAAAASERLLGLRPHDVQILGALAMAEGKIAEMQTGEGKTLAAVLAVYDMVRCGERVHVLTANDYLARRDAEWMGPLYRFLGLSVSFVTQSMSPEERREAYRADVTYATPNEVGFDFLRDQLALESSQLVLPDFAAVLVDEADSILIDEARIPLVIAGGHAAAEDLAGSMAQLAAEMIPGWDFRLDEYQRNVSLTDRGIARTERAAGVANLFEAEGVEALGAIEAALHARMLLRRDVDYIVRDGAIELVDEFKGRVAENRRWPAGLQTALEAKEGLRLRAQGRILGSITLQALMRLYPVRCGMTGTAATEAQEFREFYEMEVIEIPTHRPVIREDREDFVFVSRGAKERAVIKAIAETHASGRPVLVGTASVAESERLSALVAAAGIPHRVLNARQDAEEARIIAGAGQRGAVTISTNMAGRGTDIVLGEGVAELGGLHVIGTNRHESRRIDYQLRGRAGRQGDPGSSQFFVSPEDDLLVRFGIQQWSLDAEGVEAVQRVVEGQNFEIRQMLWKYDGLLENHRLAFHVKRREMLVAGAEPAVLLALDDLWADHLADVKELREGIHWRSWGGREPFYEFVRDAEEMYQNLLAQVERIESGEEEVEERERGATWTYVVTDQPFGTIGERFGRNLGDKLREMGLLGR